MPAQGSEGSALEDNGYDIEVEENIEENVEEELEEQIENDPKQPFGAELQGSQRSYRPWLSKGDPLSKIKRKAHVMGGHSERATRTNYRRLQSAFLPTILEGRTRRAPLTHKMDTGRRVYRQRGDKEWRNL